MKQIAIYGASGHGKVVADIARLNGYDDILFIDDGIATYLSFERFVQQQLDIPVALGVGNAQVRARLYRRCREHGLSIETLVHPSAVLADGVIVGEGTVVMANSVINSDTDIGKCCILNTSCVIEHDNSIGDFVHIAPQVACAGGVKIGDYSHIGIGSCIIQGITVGSHTVIGAGSVIIKNIENHILAYGNPCKPIKELTS